ncbi:MAG TPA: S-layer protein, partial [Methanoregula sp.]|nr:S-layer protein [Methanoregula sp.]
MNYYQIIIVFLALGLWITTPVIGVTTYLGGSPQMSAALSGTNEFTPGQDATIQVVVWNSGVNDFKFVTKGTIEQDDLPTTAKMVTIGLAAGNSPVIIKTDPQVVGDIKSQGIANVAIATKITSDATFGEYQLPLTISYTYLSSSDQEAADVLRFNYKQVNETIPITIKIKHQVKIEVLEAVPENLNVGTEGYLNLTIKNIGLEDGRKASVKILRNGASPIIPSDSSVFIGDFPHNSTVTCRYKVAVSDEAEIQSYPVDVLVMYENREGDVVSSTADTIGIPVWGKISFIITSGTVRVLQGSQSVIQIVYKNTGTRPAYHAQARLSAVEPFKSSDDTAYL